MSLILKPFIKNILIIKFDLTWFISITWSSISARITSTNIFNLFTIRTHIARQTNTCKSITSRIVPANSSVQTRYTSTGANPQITIRSCITNVTTTIITSDHIIAGTLLTRIWGTLINLFFTSWTRETCTALTTEGTVSW